MYSKTLDSSKKEGVMDKEKIIFWRKKFEEKSLLYFMWNSQKIEAIDSISYRIREKNMEFVVSDIEFALSDILFVVSNV